VRFWKAKFDFCNRFRRIQMFWTRVCTVHDLRRRELLKSLIKYNPYRFASIQFKWIVERLQSLWSVFIPWIWYPAIRLIDLHKRTVEDRFHHFTWSRAAGPRYLSGFHQYDGHAVEQHAHKMHSYSPSSFFLWKISALYGLISSKKCTCRPSIGGVRQES
jgi:hypothetical protein